MEHIERLISSSDLYQSLINNSTDSTIIIYNGRFIGCNDATAELLKLSSKDDLKHVHPAELSPKLQPCKTPSLIKAEVMMQIALDKGSHRFEWLHQDSFGNDVPVEVALTTQSYLGAEFIHCVWRDITDRDERFKQLKLGKAFFNNTNDAIIITDKNNTIIEVNAAFTEITGYQKSEAIGKKSGFMKSGVHSPLFYTKMWNTLNTTGYWKGNVCDRHKDGYLYQKELRIQAILDRRNSLTNYVATFTDLSERVDYEKKLQKLAYFDTLSGMPNRTLLLEELERRIELMKGSSNETFSIAFIDIDKFKVINDTRGHQFGDEVIKGVVERVSLQLGDKGFMGRMSGDEFLIIFDRALTTQAVNDLLKNIVTSFEQPLRLTQSTYKVTISVGMSTYPHNATNMKDLIAAADIAMYEAKQFGGKEFVNYSAELGERFQYTSKLEYKLADAIKDKEIHSYYQPIIDVKSSKVVGCESLARWQTKQGKVISPGDFIPIAEQSNQIIDLSSALIDECCQTISSFNLDTGFSLSINVSAYCLKNENFCQALTEKVRQTNLLPSQVTLEITESTLIECLNTTKDKLDNLRKLGFKLALDDFGTGFSSLSYLRQLRFDCIKIDKSFVDGLLDSDAPTCNTLIKLIIDTAHTLGAKVVAEGVEVQSQLNTLKELGCDFIQGYLLSKPLKASQFSRYYQEKKATLQAC